MPRGITVGSILQGTIGGRIVMTECTGTVMDIRTADHSTAMAASTVGRSAKAAVIVRVIMGGGKTCVIVTMTGSTG